MNFSTEISSHFVAARAFDTFRFFVCFFSRNYGYCCRCFLFTLLKIRDARLFDLTAKSILLIKKHDEIIE